jgi:pimeloyl-ACP methyl ester carboxylesterase
MELEVAGRPAFAHDGGIEFDPARPVVALIHGAGQDHSLYRYLTRLLAHRGYAALAVDLPGHGRTPGPALDDISGMAAWVLDLLGGAGVAASAIVGHSMGSLVALECAARAPARVTALFLTGPSDSMAVHPDLQRAADGMDPLAVGLIAGWSHTGAGRFGGHPDPGVWTRGVTTRQLEREAASLAADLTACAAYDAGSRAEAITCPVTIVIGSSDRMTPPGAGAEIARSLPHADVVRLDGAGHNVPGDRPFELASAALSALGHLR